MSWQSYIYTYLLAKAPFVKAGIYGHDASIWASTDGFDITEEEALALVRGCESPGSLFATGFKIEGVKYFTLKSDDRSIYGKLGSGGAIAVKTGQALIVAVYDSNVSAGNAAKLVEDLADHLISQDY